MPTLLEFLPHGDELVATRIDRLARSIFGLQVIVKSLEVPLDTDISEIKEMPDYEFCDFFEYDVSGATTYLDPDYYDLSIDRVVTHVKFDLPSPILFSDTQQLRDVA